MNKKKFSILNLVSRLLVATSLCLCFFTKVYTQTPIHGKYSLYYPDNTVMEKGKYVNGSKSGQWFYYSPNGHLDRKDKWINGQLKWQIYYNAKGKVSKTVNKNGQQNIRPACGC